MPLDATECHWPPSFCSETLCSPWVRLCFTHAYEALSKHREPSTWITEPSHFDDETWRICSTPPNGPNNLACLIRLTIWNAITIAVIDSSMRHQTCRSCVHFLTGSSVISTWLFEIFLTTPATSAMARLSNYEHVRGRVKSLLHVASQAASKPPFSVSVLATMLPLCKTLASYFVSNY